MKRLRVVVSLITQDNDFQVEQSAAAQEAARNLGVDVEITLMATVSSKASKS
jgi:hypothetical protein